MPIHTSRLLLDLRSHRNHPRSGTIRQRRVEMMPRDCLLDNSERRNRSEKDLTAYFVLDREQRQKG